MHAWERECERVRFICISFNRCAFGVCVCNYVMSVCVFVRLFLFLLCLIYLIGFHSVSLIHFAFHTEYNLTFVVANFHFSAFSASVSIWDEANKGWKTAFTWFSSVYLCSQLEFAGWFETIHVLLENWMKHSDIIEEWFKHNSHISLSLSTLLLFGLNQRGWWTI